MASCVSKEISQLRTFIVVLESYQSPLRNSGVYLQAPPSPSLKQHLPWGHKAPSLDLPCQPQVIDQIEGRIHSPNQMQEKVMEDGLVAAGTPGLKSRGWVQQGPDWQLLWGCSSSFPPLGNSCKSGRQGNVWGGRWSPQGTMSPCAQHSSLVIVWRQTVVTDRLKGKC